MEEFSKFMRENWGWISGAILLIAGGIAWLVNQRHAKQPPASPIPTDIGAVAMTALTEKYGRQIDDQQQTIDALRKAVDALTAERSDPDAPKGTDEALACLERGNTDKAEAIFQKILDTKESEGQTSLKEAAQAAKHIGALAFLHDTEKAMKSYNKASQLDPDDAEAWNRLGHLLRRTGDLAGAERAYNKVLALGSSTADRETIAKATGNLGLIALTRGDLDQAEDYHQQSLAIETELGRKQGMAAQLCNLGLIARKHGKLDKAEDYHQQALVLSTELGRKESMANQLGNLGSVAKQRGDEGEACRLWREARDLFQAIGMPHMVEQVQGMLDEAGCDEDASGGS